MNRSENLTEWQRRVALDFARACSLEPVTPIRATGQHRVAENDEPEPDFVDRGPITQPSELAEADWIAADVERDTDKAQKLLARDVRIAHEHDLQQLRIRGLL